MSVLQYPRIHFTGEIDWNPSTVNNSPSRGYDKTNVKVDLSKVPGVSKPDELLDHLLAEALDEKGRPTAYPNGGWNVYGDHGCWFHDTRVCSVDLGEGPISFGDAVITSKIQISRDPNDEPKPDSYEDPWEPWRRKNPVLVDVDPEGGDTTSQVFFDLFRVGIGAGAGFTASACSPMYARWPNRQRNLKPTEGNGLKAPYMAMAPIGVVWQATLKPSDWKTEGSEVLKRLSNPVFCGSGLLVVRFAAYRTLYYCANSELLRELQGETRVDPMKGLLKRYGDREVVYNPARSAVVGTIGVAQEDELRTANTDRLLVPVGKLKPTPPFRFDMEVQLGPVAARVDGDKLSLDVINTFPENCGELKKYKWPEEFMIKARGCTGPIAKVGFEQYGTDRYRHGGGILDFGIPEEARKAASEGILEISYGGQTVLKEQELIVDTDQRGVWIDMEETVTVEFQVRRRGEKPDACLTIGLYWGHEDQATNELVWDRLDHPDCPEKPWVEILDDDPSAVPVHNGVARIRLKPHCPGTCILVVVPYDKGERPDLPKRLTKFERVAATFVAVRVLPLNNEKDDKYEAMFEEVLEVFELIYPTTYKDRMFSSYDLPEVIAYLNAIKERTAKGETASRYMPITRDLSNSRREYLIRVLEELHKEPQR